MTELCALYCNAAIVRARRPDSFYLFVVVSWRFRPAIILGFRPLSAPGTKFLHPPSPFVHDIW